MASELEQMMSRTPARKRWLRRLLPLGAIVGAVLLGHRPPTPATIRHAPTPPGPPALNLSGYAPQQFSTLHVRAADASCTFSPLTAVRRWDGVNYAELSRQGVQDCAYSGEHKVLVRFPTQPTYMVVQGIRDDAFKKDTRGWYALLEPGNLGSHELEVRVYYPPTEGLDRDFGDAERYLIRMVNHE